MKVRPTSGLSLFAYEVAIRVENLKFSAIQLEDKVPNRFADSNRAAKVFEMKGGSTGTEVRGSAGICMGVMSTMFCRKVLASLSFPNLPQLY